MQYLKRSIEPYVVISSGNTIYKVDFNPMIRRHMETSADITVVYKEMQVDDPCNYGVLELDEDERIVEVEEKPLEAISNLVSTGIYIIQRTLLIKLLETIIPEGRYELVKDIIIRYRKRLKIMGYRFDGYWRAINSIKQYYEINMDFLKKDVRDLFTRGGQRQHHQWGYSQFRHLPPGVCW
jgi:glucose-1-phosphate adenylyltransferase